MYVQAVHTYMRFILPYLYSNYLFMQPDIIKKRNLEWTKSSSMVGITRIHGQEEALNESALRCTWRWMRRDQGTPGMQRPLTPYRGFPAGQMDLSAFALSKD